MDLSKEQIRTIIYYEWCQRSKTSECLKNMTNNLSTLKLKDRTVRKWYSQFNNGNFDVKDAPRSGRPRVAESDEVVESIKLNPNNSAEDIAYDLGLSKATVCRRLKEAGYVSKLQKWVPHELGDFNKMTRMQVCNQLIEMSKSKDFFERIVTCDEKWIYHSNQSRSRQWVAPGDDPSSVPRRGLTTKKILLCIWWDCRGIVYQEYLKSGGTIDSNNYSAMLKKVNESIKSKWPSHLLRKGVLFLQDNARPHTSVATMRVIKSLNWVTLPHPPYSPDIALSDFYLFRLLQNHLSGARFISSEDAKNEVDDFFSTRDSDFFKIAFSKLRQRWFEVLSKSGEYLND